jgi:hypothetical protein
MPRGGGILITVAHNQGPACPTTNLVMDSTTIMETTWRVKRRPPIEVTLAPSHPAARCRARPAPRPGVRTARCDSGSTHRGLCGLASRLIRAAALYRPRTSSSARRATSAQGFACSGNGRAPRHSSSPGHEEFEVSTSVPPDTGRPAMRTGCIFPPAERATQLRRVDARPSPRAVLGYRRDAFARRKGALRLDVISYPFAHVLWVQDALGRKGAIEPGGQALHPRSSPRAAAKCALDLKPRPSGTCDLARFHGWQRSSVLFGEIVGPGAQALLRQLDEIRVPLSRATLPGYSRPAEARCRSASM